MEDHAFYLQSGGGVTLGGGEPCMHPGAARSLLKRCKSFGLHTAIESCGYYPWKNLEALLPYLDLIFFDLKVMNEETHKAVTGVSHKLILENLKNIFSYIHQHNLEIDITLRTPLIPQVNDTLENFEQMIAFLKTLPEKEKAIFSQNTRKFSVELLPYHKYGIQKYKGLGLNYKMSEHFELHKCSEKISPQFRNDVMKLFEKNNIHCLYGDGL